MASNLRKIREFSRLGPVGILLFTRVAFSSGTEARTPDPSTAEVFAESPTDVARSATGEVRERVLASGLRVWARARPGVPLEVCTATPAAATTDRDRIALRVLARLLAPGGYRSAGGDYHDLLMSRGIETRASVELGALVFCARGPERELPLLLWNAAGRFARQALVERDFQLAKKDAREKESAPEGGERLARSRFEALTRRSLEADLELPVPEDVWSSLTLDDVRAAHERLFFDARTTLAVDGGFSFEVLERLVGEHLRLARGLTASTVPETSVQGSARYALVEQPGRSSAKAFLGTLVGSTSEDRLAPVALLGELERKSPKHRFSLEIDARRAIFSYEAATVGELEERRAELHRVVESLDLSKVSIPALEERRRTLVAEKVFSEGAKSMALFGAAGGLFEDWNGTKAPEVDAAALRRRLREIFSVRRTTLVELLPRGFTDPFLDAGPKTHQVVVGETLGTIAFRYGTTPEALLERNTGLEATFAVGSEVRLPKGVKKAGPAPVLHRVEPGENLTKIARKYGVSVDELRRVNGLSSDAVVSGRSLVVARDVPAKDGGAATIGAPMAGALPASGAPTSAPSTKERSSTPPSGVSSEETPAPAIERNERSSAGTQSGEAEARSEVVGSGDARERTPKDAERKPAETGAQRSAPSEPKSVTDDGKRPEARPSEVKGSETKGPETKRVEKKAAGTKNAKPPREHIVEPGDQLLKIARRYGVTVDELCEWNGLRRDSTLFVGRKLRLGSR